MSSEVSADWFVRTANVDRLELSPADYGIVTRQGGRHTGEPGQWQTFTRPDDDIGLTWSGVLVCDPGEIHVRLGSDELMHLLEGAMRFTHEDDTVTEIAPGDVIVLRRGQTVKIDFTAKCRLLFVTVSR